MKKSIFILTAVFGLAATLGRATIYTHNFTGEDGKGIVGGSPASSDFSGVDWTISGNTSGLTASSDFFVVNGGVMGAQDLDDILTWESGLFSMTGETEFDFSIDLAATGDFEASGDIFRVYYQVDGASEQNIFVGTVDESVTDDPFFIGSTELTGSLQTFETSFTAAPGTNLELFVEISNNAGAEIQSFDNISVTAIPEPSSVVLVGMAALALYKVMRKRS